MGEGIENADVDKCYTLRIASPPVPPRLKITPDGAHVSRLIQLAIVGMGTVSAP